MKITRRIFTLAFVTAVSLANSAAARPIGSNLRQAPNATWGCELAPIFDPISGVPILAQTFQATCTFRNAGYLFSNRLASYVPSNGVITRVRIRTGNSPAPFRLTIMQGSPGLCCTAKAFSKVFRPRANRINTFSVAMKVTRSAHSNAPGSIAQVTDLVAYTAVGPGTVPLLAQGTSGTYAAGSALLQEWYPFTPARIPRNGDVYTIDGIELTMQANFEPRTGNPILRRK